MLSSKENLFVLLSYYRSNKYFFLRSCFPSNEVLILTLNLSMILERDWLQNDTCQHTPPLRSRHSTRVEPHLTNFPFPFCSHFFFLLIQLYELLPFTFSSLKKYSIGARVKRASTHSNTRKFPSPSLQFTFKN